MGLPWFELDVDFSENAKVRTLAARLREPLADAYVARIYAYCYRHVRDRFDADVAVELLEDAARWKGRRGTLFDALRHAGFLETEAGKVVVHGVKERMSPHVAKRLGDADRQRKRREKAAEKYRDRMDVTPDVTRDVLRDVTRDVSRESRGNRNKNSNLASTQTGSETPPSSRPHERAAGEREQAGKLGPLGQEFVQAVQQGLGYGLVPAKNGQAEELESCLGRWGGVDPALDFVAATCRKRDTKPKSVAWLVKVLGDAAGPEVPQ